MWPGAEPIATAQPPSTWAISRRKRVADLVAAALLAVPASAIVGMASLALHGAIGRRAFVRSERAGCGGRPFEVWKLNTATGTGRAGAGRGRRVRLAAVIERSGLDELPQLWNVLRGEMSLVGPRPLTTEFVPRYSAAHRDRLAVRPGLTGWAQVRARHATTWAESFAFDVWYVRNATWRLDVRIALLTATGWRERARSGDPHARKPDLEPAVVGRESPNTTTGR